MRRELFLDQKYNQIMEDLTKHVGKLESQVAQLTKENKELVEKIHDLKDIKEVAEELTKENKLQRINHYEIIAHSVLLFSETKKMTIKNVIKFWNLKKILPHLNMTVLKNKVEEIQNTNL